MGGMGILYLLMKQLEEAQAERNAFEASRDAILNQARAEAERIRKDALPTSWTTRSLRRFLSASIRFAPSKTATNAIYTRFQA